MNEINFIKFVRTLYFTQLLSPTQTYLTDKRSVLLETEKNNLKLIVTTLLRGK